MSIYREMCFNLQRLSAPLKKHYVHAWSLRSLKKKQYCFCLLSASISPEILVRSSPIFWVCYPWPWLSSPLSALRYVCTSGFMNDVMIAYNAQEYERNKDSIWSSMNSALWRRAVKTVASHRESKKRDIKLLSITSPNVNRFSKFFHFRIQR